jgi:hypothetical protein
MNFKAPDFFGIVNQQLEYGAIEGSSISIYIFSFSEFTNLGSKALGIGIGFKSHGTCGIVSITIGVIMLGCTYLTSSGVEAKALPCLESISWKNFFSRIHFFLFLI